MLLSDVCLSVTYIGPKSRAESPRKTKIGTEITHVTRDSDTTFKIKRSMVKVTKRSPRPPSWIWGPLRDRGRGWVGEREVEMREREGPKVTAEPGPLRALLRHWFSVRSTKTAESPTFDASVCNTQTVRVVSPTCSSVKRLPFYQHPSAGALTPAVPPRLRVGHRA